MSWKEFRKRIDALNDIQRSEHFEIRFNHRNAKYKIGAGTGGVRSRALISCYIDALERLYRAMTGPDLRRNAPRKDLKPTAVYVFDSSDLTKFRGQPFAYLDHDLEVFIALPCRTNQPTVHAELQYASTSAVHEATHVFNHALRPMEETQSQWGWFDEATAVYMESFVFPGNHDRLRFGMNWIDQPEMSLDHPRHYYSAGVFVEYLAKRYGPSFVTHIWNYPDLPGKSPDQDLSALGAIEKSLAEKGKFSSKDPKESTTVFSEYCLDSYFLWDNNGLGFLPDLYARYGERAITEGFLVGPGDSPKPSTYWLDHLACRYFRVNPKDGAQQMYIKMKTFAKNGETFLKAAVASVKTDLSRGGPWYPSVTFSDDLAEFSIGPIQVATPELDHLVLVVSHCGYRPPVPLALGGTPFDDVEFSIEFECR
jgi:hypothetical protein